MIENLLEFMFRSRKRKNHVVIEERSLIPWDEMIKKASETTTNDNVEDNDDDERTIKTCSEETDSILSSSSSSSSLTSNDENNSNHLIRFDEEDDEDDGGSDTNDLLLKESDSKYIKEGEEEIKNIEFNLSKHDIVTINVKDGNDNADNADNAYTNIYILGFDISHLSMRLQFIILALSLISSTVIYGLLQEFVTVNLASRKLAFFISSIQFGSSTICSYVVSKTFQDGKRIRKEHDYHDGSIIKKIHNNNKKNRNNNSSNIPMHIFVCLSMLRAIDVSMSNLSMQYLNYSTKTLVKSSRVAFTVMTGQFFVGKRYNMSDYIVVFLIIIGVGIFLHADASTSVIFHPIGVAFLVISLGCDGMVNNLSENIMNTYNVGQDEFLFQLYLVAFIITIIVAFISGDLKSGITNFLFQSGTYAEILDRSNNNNDYDYDNDDYYSYSVSSKLIAIVIFTITGFIGSSSAAALTKNFGALIMSITGTVRKSLTLFLSLLLYNNTSCTMEHIVGIIIFLSGLFVKSAASMSMIGRKGSAYRKSNKHEIDVII